jgi:hypothetical protein
MNRKPEGSKRQRTTSASPSPSREHRRFTSQADSDDGTILRNTGAKKIRGAAARNHREKELREERERSRLEAKKKREGRAERRRVDDSEPAEELSTRASVNQSAEAVPDLVEPPSSQAATPDTPPGNQPPTSSHRKGGRPPNSRKGKLGKNQYTKDRDLQDADESPGRSQSRDVARGDENGHSHRGSINDVKSGKSKGSGGHKVTMSDMKKRASGLLDFISRTQIEMAKESLPDGESPAEKPDIEASEGIPAIRIEDPPEVFEGLSCTEMMDVLAKKLIKWQNEFG